MEELNKKIKELERLRIEFFLRSENANSSLENFHRKIKENAVQLIQVSPSIKFLLEDGCFISGNSPQQWCRKCFFNWQNTKCLPWIWSQMWRISRRINKIIFVPLRVLGWAGKMCLEKIGYIKSSFMFWGKRLIFIVVPEIFDKGQNKMHWMLQWEVTGDA